MEPAVRNLKMTVEYDGRGFHGWQKQPELRTVQGEMEQALQAVLRHPVTLYAAGRTDAGVHALAQVASVRTSSTLAAERIRAGVNALTGCDLMVTQTEAAATDFHARFSARARHYLYLLLDHPSALWSGRALLPRGRPAVERMNAAVGHLIGEQDFAAFSCRSEDSEDTGTRVIYARWERWARGAALRIAATRFLYKMVRCIVGRSLEVGLGKREPAWFAELLAKPPGRGESIASAAGLYLVAVDYDEAPPGGPWGPDCLPAWPVL